jgi:hypothetical protein
MNKMYEDLSGIMIMTALMKETKSFQLKMASVNEGLQPLVMIDSSSSKTKDGWVIAYFEVIDSESGVFMTMNLSGQKYDFVIKYVTPWSLWVHDPKFIVKLFHLKLMEYDSDHLMWWLINLNNCGPDDLFSLESEAKVILSENTKIVDDKVQNIQDDQFVLEFDHGFAGLYPELKERFQQLYANLLNKN